ncbi:ABC transporter permease [uncultured Brevibacillus sp.]|uniref:ABC transporter permease n=1 Tax=uncultured Brevibacillus sp. TaxID=169970 RepID=UPI002591BE27|nr:ABC transporter permease [uncultured Brevibacillus sp.]
MWAIIRNRLLMLVLVIFGVSFITFLMSNVIPGDPARMIVGVKASEETYQRVREQMGLNDPLYIQYLHYVKGLLSGDLGTSLRTQQPVLDDLITYFPATMELVLFTFVVAIILGVAIGVLTAVKSNTVWDYVGRIFSISGASLPVFWSGLMVIILFYGVLGWLPASERIDLFVDAPPTITGLYTVDSLLGGNMKAFNNALLHLVLPVTVLAFAHLSTISRQIRASMLEVLQQDYIKTARANGLSSGLLIFRYALRNALMPTVTVVGLSIGSLLGGAVVTETIFNWPGLGKYVVDSIANLDFPAIMGFTIMIASGYVLINLIVDLLYMALDPQIRE